MSRDLEIALGMARSVGSSYQDRAYRAAASPSGGEYGVLAQVGSQNVSGTTGGLGRAVSLQQHAEQLRHLIGNVWSCVRVIAQRIARQPIRIAEMERVESYPEQDRSWMRRRFRRPRVETLPRHLKGFHQDLNVLENHEILDCVERPNEVMVRWQLFWVTIASLELTGKAYWWIYDAPKGSEFAGRKVIWPTPAHWIEPRHTEKRLFDHWILRPEGTMQEQVVPREEILYFYYPDPGNILGAISPLQAVARNVVADEAIAEAQRRSFANGIWPGLALVVGRHPDAKVPGMPGQRPMLTKEQRAQLIVAVKQAYRGVAHYDEPIIMDALIESIQKISNTNREMDFRTSGDYTRKIIYLAYGVNPIVMGEIENANRASAAVADDNFCLLPGTPILTGTGTKGVQDVVTGDMVLTHRGRWRPVQETYARPYEGDMVRVHAATPNWTLDLTPNHPVLVRRDGATNWLPAGELRRGDQMSLPRWSRDDDAKVEIADYLPVKYMAGSSTRCFSGGRWSKHGLPDIIPVTQAFAYAAGLYAAEGHCGKSQAWWSCHRDEIEHFVAALTELAEELGLPAPGVSWQPGDAAQVYLSSTTLAKLFRTLFGQGATEKRVPEAVYEWPDEMRRRFVAGYLFGDGCVSRGTVSYSTVSPHLARGMRALLCGLGVACSLSFVGGSGEHVIMGRVVKTSDSWQGRIGADAGQIAEWLGMTMTKQRSGRRHYLVSDDAVWFPIEAIERYSYHGTVCNFSVEEDNSYLTDSGIVHNCSNCINPKIELMSEIMTAHMLPMFGAAGNLLCYLEEAQADDPDTRRAERDQMLKAGMLGGNELRQQYGLPPVHGGDIAYIQQAMVPVNVVREDDVEPEGAALKPGETPPEEGQGGQNKPPEGQNKPPAGADGQDSQDDQDGGDKEPLFVGGRFIFPPGCRTTTLAGKLGRAATLAFWKSSRDAAEKELADAVLGWFQHLGTVARNRVAEAVSRGAHPAAALIDEALPAGEWTDRLRAAAKPVVRAAAVRGAVMEWELNFPRRRRSALDSLRLKLPPAVQQAVDRAVDDVFGRDYWEDVTESAKDQLKKAIDDGLRDGRSGSEIAADVKEALGPDGGRARAERIARTEAGAGLNAGQWESYRELVGMGVARSRTWSALDDKDTRDDHAEADGQEVAGEDKFVVGGEECDYPGDPDLSPEQRVNCILPGALVQGRVQAAARSFYRGQAVEIVTRSGRRLALTPNHPVLTEDGFIAAGAVQTGQQVLSYNGEIDLHERLAVTENVDDMPPKIEEVFGALALAGAPEIMNAHAPNFHGDGKSLQSQIEVVRADRVLLQSLPSSRFQKGPYGEFAFADSSSLGGSAFGQRLRRIFGTAASFPSCTALAENGGAVAFFAIPLKALCVGPAAYLDTGFSESAKKDAPIVASLIREMLDRFSGLVSLDEVIEVRNFDFAGHVYDLQCQDGLIVAEGIYISNCRCVSITNVEGAAPEESPEGGEAGNRLLPHKESHFAVCDRDEHGHCLPANGGKPAGGGKDPVAALHEAGEKAAAGTLAKFKAALGKITNAPVLKQVKQVANVAKKLTGKLYKTLESRYGKGTAIACMAAGQVADIGSIGVGAMMGVPMYVPGMSILGTLPAIAVAEVYHQLRKLKKDFEIFAKGDEPDLAQAKKLVKPFLKAVKAAIQAHLEKNKEKIGQVMQESQKEEDGKRFGNALLIVKKAGKIKWRSPNFSGDKIHADCERATDALADLGYKISAKDLLKCLEDGDKDDLSDAEWEVLLNSDSHRYRRIRDVIDYVDRKRKKIHGVLEEFVRSRVRAPIILRLPKGGFVINGSTRLMVARVFDVSPKCWFAQLPATKKESGVSEFPFSWDAKADGDPHAGTDGAPPADRGGKDYRGGSYFEDCPRDEHGHCLPSGGEPFQRNRPILERLKNWKDGDKLLAAALAAHRTAKKAQDDAYARAKASGEKMVAAQKAAQEKPPDDVAGDPAKLADWKSARSAAYNDAAKEYVGDRQALDRAMAAVRTAVGDALRADAPASMDLRSKDFDDKAMAGFAGAAKWVGDMVNEPGGYGRLDVKIAPGGRESALPGSPPVLNLKTTSDAATVVHEVGHTLEFAVPGVKAAAMEFLEVRCGMESPTKLADVCQGCGYRGDETGRKDQFGLAFDLRQAYYCGKQYPTGDTEIVSMGLEKLHSDPEQFLTKDPEYAKLIIGILHGAMRK